MQLCFDRSHQYYRSWQFYLLSYATFSCNFLQFEYILTAFVIVKLKSSQDILQGLSKLDYLIKYSVFQVYKLKP